MQMSQNRQLFCKQTSQTVSQTFNFSATNEMIGVFFFFHFFTATSPLGPRGGSWSLSQLHMAEDPNFQMSLRLSDVCTGPHFSQETPSDMMCSDPVMEAVAVSHREVWPCPGFDPDMDQSYQTDQRGAPKSPSRS